MGELDTAWLHKTSENIISQLIIVLFHTLFIADLQDSYQRTIVTLQHNRKAPTCRAESHLVSRTPVSIPPHMKPNWLAALGGGRAVESQGGTKYLSPSRTQEFCSNLGLCAIKTIKNQWVWLMCLFGIVDAHCNCWAVPAAHLALGNLPLEQVAIGAPFSPGQGCSCSTQKAQKKAQHLCSGSCMKWVKGSGIKQVPQTRISWTFPYFYNYSKPHQVVHLWFQISAICHSTSVFFFSLTASRKHRAKLKTSDYYGH